jgi:hypothetical protein
MRGRLDRQAKGTLEHNGITIFRDQVQMGVFEDRLLLACCRASIEAGVGMGHLRHVGSLATLKSCNMTPAEAGDPSTWQPARAAPAVVMRAEPHTSDLLRRMFDDAVRAFVNWDAGDPGSPEFHRSPQARKTVIRCGSWPTSTRLHRRPWHRRSPVQLQ